MRKSVRDEVAPRELELAKAYLIGSYFLSGGTVRQGGEPGITLEEAGLGLDYPERYRGGIARVTAADVRRVAGSPGSGHVLSTVMVTGKRL